MEESFDVSSKIFGDLKEGILVLSRLESKGFSSDDKEGEITDNPTDFIKTWVDIAKPALSKMYFDHKDENIEVNSERAVLLYSYNNLLTYPWLNDAVNENSLDIHAWWLDFKSVMLWKKAQGSDSFMPMEF